MKILLCKSVPIFLFLSLLILPAQAQTNSAGWHGRNVSVACAGKHTVTIKSDGTLWSWGYNHYGQLGDGTTVDKSSPVQVGIATDWQSVVCGHLHTAALKSDGTLWVWGSNEYGQLGDGTAWSTIPQSNSVVPGQVCDFDGDRTSDILWHHIGDGVTVLYRQHCKPGCAGREN